MKEEEINSQWPKMSTLPLTNFRGFVGVMLSVIFVLFVLAGIMLDKIDDSNQVVVSIVGSFILVQMGFDIAQFRIKRKTYVAPRPPATSTPPDREDAPQGGESGKV